MMLVQTNLRSRITWLMGFSSDRTIIQWGMMVIRYIEIIASNHQDDNENIWVNLSEVRIGKPKMVLALRPDVNPEVP